MVSRKSDEDAVPQNSLIDGEVGGLSGLSRVEGLHVTLRPDLDQLHGGTARLNKTPPWPRYSASRTWTKKQAALGLNVWLGNAYNPLAYHRIFLPISILLPRRF